MANAAAVVVDGYDGCSTLNTSEDVDSDDGTATTTSKENGSTYKEMDRYGFVGGSQYTDPTQESRLPVAVIRDRELKWIDMLENWEKWMSKRFKKVKERCRKGIPPSMRAKAWLYLSGGKFLLEHNQGRYENYLSQPGNLQSLEEIRKDLDRQFPFHELFIARDGHGQEDLFSILKAYTVHNPADGYCQAQAPLAAVLLMHMPAEHAFWCFVSVCEKYLPGYYSPGLEAIQLDGEVLFGLLKQISPLTYKHLKRQRVEPVLCMTEWFMCVYARTLPWSSVLRIWDMFLCEGVKVMFRVALLLFRCVLGRQEQLAECPSLYEIVEKLRRIPSEYLQEEYLVRECLRLPIAERDMEREHQRQLVRWRENKEKARIAELSGDKSNDKGKKPKKNKISEKQTSTSRT